MTYTINDAILICGFYQSTLTDGISSTEFFQLRTSQFFKKYYTEDSKDLCIDLLENKLINKEFITNEIIPIISSEDDEVKTNLIFALIKLANSDADISSLEKEFIKFIASSLNLQEDILETHLEDLEHKVSNYTINEMITFCALTMAISDGDLSDDEIEFMKNDSFFSEHYSESGAEKFKDAYKSVDLEPLLIIINNDFDLLKIIERDFKIDLILGLLRLSSSDGYIDDNEKFILENIAVSLGLNDDDLTKIINGETERISTSSNSVSSSSQKSSKESEDSNCFVVTATLGDQNHPILVDYRSYRDNILRNYFLGRTFIKVYYRIGPYLASLIKRNEILRKISLILIVTPVYKLIKKSKNE